MEITRSLSITDTEIEYLLDLLESFIDSDEPTIERQLYMNLIILKESK